MEYKPLNLFTQFSRRIFFHQFEITFRNFFTKSLSFIEKTLFLVIISLRDNEFWLEFMIEESNVSDWSCEINASNVCNLSKVHNWNTCTTNGHYIWPMELRVGRPTANSLKAINWSRYFKLPRKSSVTNSCTDIISIGLIICG